MWHNLAQWGLVAAGLFFTAHLAVDTAKMAWEAYKGRTEQEQKVDKTGESKGRPPIGGPPEPLTRTKP